MRQPFFPDPIFGWVFICCLLAFLVVAAVIDIRTTRIPKTLTLTIAAAGLLANVVRGVLLAQQNIPTWQLDAGPSWIGAIDGLLFSVVGLLFAFIVFFGMWMLGSCGGGDVKLCAAIGAWIGSVYTVYLLFATVVTLAAWILARVIFVGVPTIAKVRGDKPKRRGKDDLPPTRFTFSFPALVATAAVMLWCFRYDLQLIAPEPTAVPEAQHASISAWQY